MALSRTELIARGLAHAGHLTGHGIPVTNLIDSNHFSHLSPEEKIEVLAKYSDMIKPDERATPSTGQYVRGGIRSGLLAAIPVALGAGVFTLPSVKVLKLAKGNPTAMKDIATRVLGPVGLTLGAGALAGTLAALIQQGKDVEVNRYISRAVDNVSNEHNPTQKKVNAAALLALSNELTSTRRYSSNYGESQVMPGLGNLINKTKYQDVMPKINDVRRMPVYTAYGDPVADERGMHLHEPRTVSIPYDDWSSVWGINGGREIK